MTITTILRSARTVSTIMLLLGLMVLLAGITISGPTQAAASNATATNQSHTLEIIRVNGTVNYSVTISGNVSHARTHAEDTDSIGGNIASGSVGGHPWEPNSSDAKDVIRFTGEIYDFDINDKDGEIRVKLDGKPIDPASLRTTPTPSSSTSTTETATPSSTASVTSPPSPSTDHSPTHASPANEATPTDTGANLFSLTQIINTVIGLFFLALVGTGAVLYLRR